jgi:DNA repair exonuclease SbcCD nuclease subunit
VKVVVVSDAHHDWVTSGVARAEEVERALWQSVEVAREQRAAAWVFAGDLCDPDDVSSVLRAGELAVALATELSRFTRSVWLTGNHDVLEDGRGTSTLQPLRGMRDGREHPVNLCERPCRMTVADGHYVLLVALPYVALASTYDPTSELRRLSVPRNPHVRSGDAPMLVVGHLSVPGVQPGEEVKELARGRDVVLPLAEIARLPGKVTVVNGHYHRAQTFRSPEGVDVHVPGSLVRLTHGEEAHEPSILVLDL